MNGIAAHELADPKIVHRGAGKEQVLERSKRGRQAVIAREGPGPSAAKAVAEGEVPIAREMGDRAY